MNDQPTAPFGIERVSRTPLANPPLEKVIFQVQFPSILVIRDEDRVAPFQDALRHRYPTLRQHQEHSIELTEEGVKATKGTIWRLSDDRGYELSLAPTFVALAVGLYESRVEFRERVVEALTVLNDVFAPGTFDRIGVRYLNRVVDDAFVVNLDGFVRKELLGVAAFTGDAGMSKGEASRIHSDGFQTTARWGLLPAGTVVDPRVMNPADIMSWFLDVDTFKTGPENFDPDVIASIADACADADYRFFRWAVTRDFLHRFGGNPE